MNRTRTQPSTLSRDTVQGEKGLVLGFHGVRYQVKDVRRSVEFYTKHLGFKLGHQALPAFADVSIDNLTMLLSGPEASGSSPDAGWSPSGTRRMEPRGSSSCRSSSKNRIAEGRRVALPQRDGGRSRRKTDPTGRSRWQCHRAVRAGATGSAVRKRNQSRRGVT